MCAFPYHQVKKPKNLKNFVTSKYNMVKFKEGEMEVVRKAALAYFGRSTPEVKQLAHEAFDEADDDGNGRISLEEFLEMADEEHKEVSIIFFKEIDTNGDGSLDFHEFLILYFMVIFGSIPTCDECDNILVNIYFSCHECHLSSSSDSYDLCADCYRRGKFSHSHKVFLDNLTLLNKCYKSIGAGKSEDKPEVDRISLDSDRGQIVETT
ncbi:hypothetical protein Leryth_016787 [Lithospermum erythrorhizon]|nr:hypothetical protein Leryth_016787 [Lithospermum erythrorhizon]